ncbi:hypothetical protein [Xanthomonas arboricola]|nr:hypothetical protein [Xanthomonas arboricola]
MNAQLATAYTARPQRESSVQAAPRPVVSVPVAPLAARSPG